MNLWQKDNSIPGEMAKSVNHFTVGKDREMDIQLASFGGLTDAPPRWIRQGSSLEKEASPAGFEPLGAPVKFSLVA